MIIRTTGQMPAVTKSSDLCPTPIHEQFDPGDITAVIRREEQHGLCDFVRTSHSTHRHAGYEARLYLLDLFLSLYRAI
jgi:hypothetical protein